MSRTRRNSGIIGKKATLKNFNRSGSFNLDDVVYNKTNTGQTFEPEKINIPTLTWPKKRDTDPHFWSVRAHYGDMDYSNHMLKDQSGNNWDTYMTINAYQRAPISTYFGPRYTDWCSDFYENSYITVADAANLRFGNGQFSIQFWVKLRKRDAVQYYIMGKGNSAGVTISTLGWVIGVNTSNQIFFFDAQGNQTITNSTALDQDRWYWIDITRGGTGASQMSVGVNGSYTIAQSSGNFTDTNPLYIGRDRVLTSTANVCFWGRMSDLRIRTGVWSTGSSTPTNYLGSDANTVFYMRGNVPHADNIVYNAAGQQTQSAYQNMFRFQDSPFLYVDNTTTPVVSNRTTMLTGNGAHSLYFWNTDCYLKVWDVQTNPTLSLQFGTNQFTVEAWVYGAYNSWQPNGIIGKGSGNSNPVSGSGWSLWINGSGFVVWDDNSSQIVTTTNALQVGSWYHIAASRTGTGSNQFYIYVNGNLTYQGTLATNYTQTDFLCIGGTRNQQYLWNGYLSGIRISNIGRYSGALTPFNVESTSPNFKDTSMTVDANTVLLVGTTGTSEPANGHSHYREFGQSGMAPVRFSNEILAHLSPYSRSGHSYATYRDDRERVRVTQNGSNYAFGTGDFSIEMWMSSRHMYDGADNTTWRNIWSTQSTYNDAGLSLRANGRNGIELHGNNNVILCAYEYWWRHGSFWAHICVQRTNGALALYVNGRKLDETVYTTSITCPANEFFMPGCQSPNMAYGSNHWAMYSDWRILKGSGAYSVGTSNPNTFEIPQQPLTAITNTVLLVNTPYWQDTSGNLQRIEPGSYSSSNATNPTYWDTYIVPIGPYNGYLPWDRTKQNYGAVSGTSYGMYLNGAWRTDSTYPDFSWITRMTAHNPWTIETWIYNYMTYPTGNSPGPGEQYRSVYTATTAGHEGWSFIINTSNTSASKDDVTFEFFTAHNSAVQRIYSSSSFIRNLGNGFAWWHVAVCYDNTKTNKIALFVNGQRASTSAAFSNGQKMWNTYRMQHTGRGCGPIRVSSVARYNNDATTYTVPVGRWAYDQYTFSHIDQDEAFPNRATSTSSRQYGVLPSFKYKRFGNASMKFGQKDPSTLCERIYMDHTGLTTHLLDTRIWDFTWEAWAMWWDSTAGGPSLGGQGRCLWQWSNNMIVLINGSGYWRMLNGNSTNPPNGTFSGNSAYSTGYDYNPSLYYAANTTTGVFDHIVMMRRANNFYLYVNGIEAGILYGSEQGQSGDQGQQDYYSPPGSVTINIGHDTYSQSGISWAGFIQDLRVSHMARYETRAKLFPSITFTVTGSSNCSITSSTNLNNLCVMTQAVTFASGFGAISSGTTYYITNVADNSITVSTVLGGSAVTVGTTTGLSITATTVDKTVSAMCHAQTDTFALPTTLLPSY